MSLAYYTMDDLRLGRGGFLQKRYTCWTGAWALTR